MFDAAWYRSFYGLSPLSPQPSPFQHYLQIGTALAFSPGPDFDESAYRTAYPDVVPAVEDGVVLCGHEHYLRFGKDEGRTAFAHGDLPPGSATHPMHGGFADAVRDEFDADWYVGAYPETLPGLRRGSIASPLWHYLTEGAAAGLSPNAWFDERWYVERYADVAQAKESGNVPNGFGHYLGFGKEEGRFPSAAHAGSPKDRIEGLIRPVGIEGLAALERKLSPFPFRVDPSTGHRRVNVLLPALDKNIMFGGYIGALNFINRLQERGWPIRILITNDPESNAERARTQFGQDGVVADVLERAELINLVRRSVLLDITPDDSFVAYSMWDAHHADIFAAALDRRFTFFIQEFEPAFHHYDCWHAVGTSIYAKPHFAIFNSRMLCRYFREQGIGVFSAGPEAGHANSVVFEHALSIPGPPRGRDLVRDGVRRLLFYARPEAHGARNLFEVGMAGLRRAIAEGVFDEGDWSFEGVGTLSTDMTVDLRQGHVLQLKPRLDINDYASALRRYEVGLSLQYSPHPGLVHFEMAASGIVTVTNTFANRDAADLRAVSPNLVPVEPTPDGVAQGLAEAALRARDVTSCVRDAQRPWVTSWKESFNEDVMARIEAELA
jgi:hypothetical protein